MQAREVAIVAEINGQYGQFIGKNNADPFQWKQPEVVYFSMWRQLERYCCDASWRRLNWRPTQS